MVKKIIILILAGGLMYFPRDAYPAHDFLRMGPIGSGDRILILAPHPDDETLGAGGVIQEAVRAGARTRVLYITNGEYNQLAFMVYEKRFVIKQKAFIEMGKLRQREAVAAMKLLGLPEENLIFLGYPDFGTLAIFQKYWGDIRPFRNVLTRISSVPYVDALSPNAPYKGEAILWDIESVIRKFRPTRIFVTNSVDTNKDHKACALFLQVALWNLKGRIPDPRVYSYIVHCNGWPKPANYHPSLYLNIPKVLARSRIEWLSRDMSPEETGNKRAAILLYKSQRSDAASFLLSFARRNELFGDFPVIDLTGPGAADDDNIYGKTDGKLFINVPGKREGPGRPRIYIFLSGYDHEIEFSQMPKIKIIVDADKAGVLDRGRYVKVKGLDVTEKRHNVAIKIPLESLRDPEYVLASVDSGTDNTAYDLNAWRVIKLK